MAERKKNNIPDHVKALLDPKLANDPNAVWDPVDKYPENPETVEATAEGENA